MEAGGKVFPNCSATWVVPSADEVNLREFVEVILCQKDGGNLQSDQVWYRGTKVAEDEVVALHRAQEPGTETCPGRCEFRIELSYPVMLVSVSTICSARVMEVHTAKKEILHHDDLEYFGSVRCSDNATPKSRLSVRADGAKETLVIVLKLSPGGENREVLHLSAVTLEVVVGDEHGGKKAPGGLDMHEVMR